MLLSTQDWHLQKIHQTHSIKADHKISTVIAQIQSLIMMININIISIYIKIFDLKVEMKQIQNQYIDIPMKIQDTPHYLLEKAPQFQLPETPSDTAADLLSRIQEAIKKQNTMDLYILTTVYFPKADAEKYPNGDWPTPSKIQQITQIDFTVSSQNVYSELILRKRFDRTKPNDDQFIEAAQQCWETYTSIFQLQATRVKFPPLLIWEFMENFSYQFSQYHFRLQTLPAEKINPQWFNVQKTYEILDKMSKDQNNSSTLQFFKHYSVIIHATIQAYFGQFTKVVQTISNIKYSDLIYYSKAFGSIIHLFLTASYSHFMISQYNQAACLCQLVLNFYQKHKKYLEKSADRHFVRNHERIVGLLSIVYIFLQQQPKNEIMEIFRNTAVRTKEKQYKQKISDKYHKLKQHDYNSFMKLFNFSSLPLIGPRNQVDQRQKQIYNRFEKLKEINLNVIIHNYKEIPIEKIAKILNITKEQVLKQIEQFNKIQRGQTAWSSTILYPLLKQKRKQKLQIIDDVLKIQEQNELQQQQAWSQYREEISWLTRKVEMI